ncbi:MAG: S24 family peptidase [Desulfoprunum sp.]|uniref:LexA family protein n=1 Tax=Desulfoprunum sp. TaxID=2020866 RepID=UPI003C7504DE
MTIPDPKISFPGATTPPEPPNVGPVLPERSKPNMVPLIRWVQAGEWQEADDPSPPGYAEQWVQTFETDHPNAFALTVVVDSMRPEFTKGDIVVVDPGLEPASGDYVIAKNGADATFKQLVRDGANVLLKPANDRYPIKDVTGQPVKIVGVVVGKQKQYQ